MKITMNDVEHVIHLTSSILGLILTGMQLKTILEMKSVDEKKNKIGFIC